MTKKYQLKIAVLSLSALAFFSCKKDDKPAVNGEMMTFTGRIGGGAKTEINGLEMTWSKGDQVRINGVDCGSELTSDRKTATFTGAVAPADEYKAYYPASLYTEGKYVLPSIQTCYPDSVNTLSGINPMYAESATTDLQFHNICALMKLVVKGEGTVKKITVTADKPLSGEFEIEPNAEGGYYAQLTPTSKDAGTLTLDCGDGVTLSKTAATTFYIALPQGEYKNLVFTLTGRGGLTWSSTPVTRNLKAGEMQVRELAGASVVKPETLSGVFSVSADKRVRFSRGNLYCMRTAQTGGGYSYDFAFEEEQYDCRSYNYSGQAKGKGYKDGEYDTPENTSGLFQWVMKNGTSLDPDGYGAFTEESSITGSSTDVMDWGPTMGSGWRTLTDGNSGEWKYLFDSRSTTYSSGSTTNIRYAEVKVNGVCGILLFPDAFSWPLGSDKEPTTFNTHIGDWNNAKNYAGDDFAALESAGCVFLPATGYRNSTSVNDVGSFGDYWSSSPNSTDGARSLRFGSGYVGPAKGNYRYDGFSVRLVQSVGVVEN